MGKTERILLRCGKIFDGIQERYLEQTDILVEGNHILQVEQGIPAEAADRVIDLSDKVVTPGLMEIHNHAVGYHNENVPAILNEFLLKTPTYRALGILRHLNELLEHGFTLVRDCCYVERGWTCVDIRDAISAGIVDGPRYVVCGHSGGIDGGHTDLRQFISDPDVQPVAQSPNLGSGAAHFQKWVRTEFLHNVDFIKFHIDGGFATPHDDPEHRHMSEEEIQAIIETAHSCNRKATAHIYGDESARLAIQHGVDGIEHGALLSPETYDLAAEKGVYIVPTMCFFDRGVFLDEDELSRVPAYMAEKYRIKHEKLCRSREALVRHIENGTLLVGYGTDLGAVEPMLPAWREYETMVRSGVTPFKALKVATSNSAKIVERPDLGHLAPGKLADIVAWDQDPVTEPKALRSCAFVMKDGKIVKEGERVYKTGPRL